MDEVVKVEELLHSPAPVYHCFHPTILVPQPIQSSLWQKKEALKWGKIEQTQKIVSSPKHQIPKPQTPNTKPISKTEENKDKMLPGIESRDGIVIGSHAGCSVPVSVTGSFAGCSAPVFIASLVPNTWEIADRTSGEQVSKVSAGACVGTATRKYFYDMFLTFTLKVKTSRAPLILCCVIIVFINHIFNHVINLYWGLLIWSLHIHPRATTGAFVWSSSGSKKNELKFAFLGACKWNNKTFSYRDVYSSGPHSYMMYQSEFHDLWHPFDKMYWPQSMAGWT